VPSGSPYVVSLAEMIDMALIKLGQLLGCSVDELIALVKPMSADTCEQYARAILGQIGGPSFERLIIRIVETAVNDGGSPPTDVDAYYFSVSDLFPHVAIENDVVGRLFFLAIHMTTLRLEKHPSLATH
jgi:hypothetical protein